MVRIINGNWLWKLFGLLMMIDRELFASPIFTGVDYNGFGKRHNNSQNQLIVIGDWCGLQS